MWCHLLLGMPLIALGLFIFLPWQAALPVYGIVAFVSLVIWAKGLQALRLRVVTGMEGMLGEMAEVRSWNGREGIIAYNGELWGARSFEPLAAGDKVEIAGFEGLKALVQRVDLME